MNIGDGRPSVTDVARRIRARTKDANGNEIGTFDDETRPTSDEVEEIIDACIPMLTMRVPMMQTLPCSLEGGFRGVIALAAACEIEKAYWPEQARSDRSAYQELLAEFLDARAAFLEVAGGITTSPTGGAGSAMIPVGSWTSIPAPGFPDLWPQPTVT